MLLLCQGAAVPEMLVNQFSQYRMGTLVVISGFPVFQTVVVKKERNRESLVLNILNSSEFITIHITSSAFYIK